MKVKECPNCGSTNLGDYWCIGRKLQQFCREEDCTWKGKPRIPEKIPITNTKELRIGNFPGWDYEIYDKYGHTETISCSYDTRADALKELKRDLMNGEQDKDAGPYTGVLFHTPVRVTIKGKMFKSKKS